MGNPEIFYPKQAQLFVSEVCNEGCAYCSYTLMTPKDRKNLLSKELPVEQWQEATNFLYQKMGIRLFTMIGGEPAAKKGIERLVGFMSRKLPQAEVIFLTSGIPLLKNSGLRHKLVEAGMRNVVVSVDGIRGEPSLEIDLSSELVSLKKGSERKSVLGLYFLHKLKEEFPNVPFKFGAGCIVNKQTLDLILPTYYYLSQRGIYLNLCPEQTACFGRQSATVLTEEYRSQLEEISQELVRIKNQPGNYLMPSEDFLRLLPTMGIDQSFQCSARPFPSTLHLNSAGNIPYCSWRPGEMDGEFNIMDLVRETKNYQEWLERWRNDGDGRQCSCSWTFPDRAGDFNSIFQPTNPNIWYNLL